MTYTTERWDTTFRTNVYTGFWLTRAAAKIMPPGSSIVWTISDIFITPVASLHDYSASKGAVAMMVRTLGESLLKKGFGSTESLQASHIHHYSQQADLPLNS